MTLSEAFAATREALGQLDTRALPTKDEPLLPQPEKGIIRFRDWHDDCSLECRKHPSGGCIPCCSTCGPTVHYSWHNSLISCSHQRVLWRKNPNPRGSTAALSTAITTAS